MKRQLGFETPPAAFMKCDFIIIMTKERKTDGRCQRTTRDTVTVRAGITVTALSCDRVTNTGSIACMYS